VGSINEQDKEGMTLADIFKVDTRFLILTYLLMYPEMTLPELTKKVGKSKSTIFEHLKKMMKAGLITKRVDDSDSRTLPAKLISLNKEKFDEISQKKKNKEKPPSKTEEEKKQKLIEGIEVYKGFIDVNIHFLTKWREYLDELRKKAEVGDVGEWEKLKEGRISILTAITKKKAKELSKKLEVTIEVAEQEDDETLIGKPMDKKKKPYFITANILPIDLLIDSLKEKDK
jgi:DNA-binding MarR family transcriptional regulator